jgi:hypothetical protein
VNLAEAEQWADSRAALAHLDPLARPLVPLMANYHHMQHELERLTTVLKEAAARAEHINRTLDTLDQQVKR